MELKLMKNRIFGLRSVSLNCTFMELKSDTTHVEHGGIVCLNCTFMELK